jgi:C-terminal processing protease CtpA/Prc
LLHLFFFSKPSNIVDRGNEILINFAARGFGFRVVGGKSGPDGRLFAYIVWTVPQGPADQAGLMQGDRVLEWNGVSLIDKSFEEVCAVMDRAGDAAELLVEHFPDM